MQLVFLLQVNMETDFKITAEEMKVWQDKQKKRDEVSNTMGEYLLKGYRMLDAYCSDCGVSKVTNASISLSPVPP